MKVGSQVSWNTIGNISSLFFQWLTIVLLPMVADFSEAGVFSIAISITSIFYTIASCYLHQVQLADQYHTYTENHFLVTRIITIAIGFVLLCITLLFLDYSKTQNAVIIAYMLYRNILNLAYVYSGTIEIYNHFDFAGKACTLEGIVSFTVFFISYICFGDLFISTMSMAIVGGSTYFIIIMGGRKRYLTTPIVCRFKVDAHIKRLLVVGFVTLISALCPIIITALPKLLLNEYSTEEIVGIFSTLTAPTIVIPTIITAIFAPFIGSFSEMARHGDIKSIRFGFYKTSILIMAFGAFAATLSIFLGPPFFNLLYTDSLDEYVKFFPIMVMGIVFYSLGMVSTNILIAKNQMRILSISAISSLVASFAVMAIMVPANAMSGATYGLFVSYGIFGLLTSLCVLIAPLRNDSSYKQHNI